MGWFHISYTWEQSPILISPRTGRTDTKTKIDTTPFIAVCPTPEQCLLALGEWRDCPRFRLYKAISGSPKPATWVFDYDLTEEHRFLKPTRFKFVKEYPINLRYCPGLSIVPTLQHSKQVKLAMATKPKLLSSLREILGGYHV